MVRRRHNRGEDPDRIPNGQQDIEKGPWLGPACFSRLKRSPKNPRVVYKCGANNESVSKMHRRHSCQSIHVFPAHPDALCVIPSNTVEEPVFWGQEPRWHARVEDEDYESEEVREGHRSSHNCESVEGGGGIVVPCNESGECQQAVSALN